MSCEAALTRGWEQRMGQRSPQQSLQIVVLHLPVPLLKFLRTLRLWSCYLVTFRSAISTAKASCWIHLRPAAFLCLISWMLRGIHRIYKLSQLLCFVGSIGMMHAQITVILCSEEYWQLLNTEHFLKIPYVLGIYWGMGPKWIWALISFWI